MQKTLKTNTTRSQPKPKLSSSTPPSTIIHPWPPTYDSASKILILGTIPSPKSRENGFYYGHPQNCFWRVLAGVLGVDEPAVDTGSKAAFLLRHHIALWDVLHSCEIDGAADSSIQAPVVNQFRPIIDNSEIRAIFTTGKTATALFERYCAEEAGMHCSYLPSTSPANRAAWGKPGFLEAWGAISVR